MPGPRDVPQARVFWGRFEDLVLEVALVHHRFYAETYTFDIYLGRTFTFALAARGYPAFAFGRFTKFTDVSPTEDGFLTGYAGDAVELAVEALQFAVTGYTGQQGLADAVREVELLRIIRDIDMAIVASVDLVGAIDPETLRLQPKLTTSSLPSQWYVAAENALLAHEGALGFPVNANHVRSYALDAWRCVETSAADWI